MQLREAESKGKYESNLTTTFLHRNVSRILRCKIELNHQDTQKVLSIMEEHRELVANILFYPCIYLQCIDELHLHHK